jgi:ATP-binding cassette subfamily B (MDR/TAP) protein 9
MFMISWQLSILAFISVPVITVLSKWYGQFVRSLTKLMQSKLAEGNSVSEAAISSMPTVRAFDAAPTEYKEFKGYMDKYLALTVKAAIAYSGYATVATSLPQLVTALVVFYGGLMVRNGDISSGELVSFLLYLQSLSDAFSSIGYIFSSLTQAVGAADKVFELMNRKPKLRPPSSSSPSGNITSAIEKTRTSGLEPETCRGEIALQNVNMVYPARPRRQVLNGMTLTVPPGKIIALV